MLCVDRCTLKGRSRELLDKLSKAMVGTRPIIWVGHSMGGVSLYSFFFLFESVIPWEVCLSTLFFFFLNRSFHGGYASLLSFFLSVILWGVSLLSFFYQTFCRGFVSLLYIRACVCGVCVCVCVCVPACERFNTGPLYVPVLHHYFVTQSYSLNLSR